MRLPGLQDGRTGRSQNVDEATRYFSYDQLKAVEAYMQELRAQKYKPKVKQLDESWLVRIRTKGQKEQTATFPTCKEAESFAMRVKEERGRGLFVDLAPHLDALVQAEPCLHKVEFATLQPCSEFSVSFLCQNRLLEGGGKRWKRTEAAS